MTDYNPFNEIDKRLQRIEGFLSKLNIPEKQVENPLSYVSIEDAAKIVNLPRTTIYKKIKDIPHYKHGRSLMFKPDELIKWVESYRVKPRSEIQDKVIENLQRVS